MKGYGKEHAAPIAGAHTSDDQNPSEKSGKAPAYQEWTEAKPLYLPTELEIARHHAMTKGKLFAALRV